MMFQHTAARRRLLLSVVTAAARAGFQHTAARRRLPLEAQAYDQALEFQHTAARRRLPECGYTGGAVADVSTHSRAEAAAPYIKK